MLPLLLYNSEMWFYFCTEFERSILLKHFQANDFHCHLRTSIDDRMFSSAEMFHSSVVFRVESKGRVSGFCGRVMLGSSRVRGLHYLILCM